MSDSELTPEEKTKEREKEVEMINKFLSSNKVTAIATPVDYSQKMVIPDFRSWDIFGLMKF